jgi:putative PIN family toxin of toxin-antitoxin system
MHNVRVVIDTNVSAAWRDRLPERMVLRIAGDSAFTWLASPAIVEEYREVLARPKFALPPEVLTRWREIIVRQIQRVRASEAFDFPRDPADGPFLACALAGQADFLISGDRDFESLPPGFPVKIVSVREFAGLFNIE